MTSRQIRRARVLREDAGSVKDRHNIDQSLVGRCESDITVLTAQKSGVAGEYREARANWRTEEVDTTTIPYAITEDVAIARNYWVAGVIALLAEMALAWWMFGRRGLSPLAGALFALCVTLIVERALHFSVFGPTAHRRPKRAVRRLKRVAFYPALACFLLAVVMTVVARTVEGPVAANSAVVTMVTSGLFFLALGLMFLASSLFAAAFIYSWSRRLADRYHTLDGDERATRAFLAEVRREMPATEQQTPSASSAPDDSAEPQARTHVTPIRGGVGTASLLLIATLAMTTGACADLGAAQTSAGTGDDVNRVVAKADASPAPATSADHAAGVAPAQPDSACHVALDVSGSLSDLPGAWKHLRDELPDFAIAQQCTRLDVWTFSDDGWIWSSLASVTLPPVPVLASAALPAELEGWKNFQDAAEARLRAEREDARARRIEAVSRALGVLDGVDARLIARAASKTSDPLGVLRRIAQTPARVRQIFVVITDMADTASGTKLLCIPAPGGDVRTLVLLVPARPDEARLVGMPTTGVAQFEQRSRALREAAPWVKVLPYFATGLAHLLTDEGT